MKFLIGTFLQLTCLMSFGFNNLETLTTLMSAEQEKTHSEDSSLTLVMSKGNRTIIIETGDRITIRVNENRYRGRCLILNDSTIYLDSTSIQLSEIDMIAKSNTGKVFLLIFASAPINILGTISILDGHVSSYEPHIWVGSVFLGIATGGIITEGILGKRYRKFKKFGRQDGTIQYKWTYVIE